MYRKTTATHKIQALRKRIRCVAGGTSASKTVSIILLLILLAQTSKKKIIISVVSESMPHLKRGCIRTFLDIMQEHGYYQDANFNKTDFIYTFPNGTIIEFFSADQPDKVRGPRRDVLFINEANNVSYETFTQLEIRTNKLIYLDWNPISEFWAYGELINKRQDVDFITLNYKDNEALPESIRQTIEARRSNKNWFRVFGEGLLGEPEGKIFKDWQFIDEIPHEAKLERRGLDFGYTNDPSAIVAIYSYNGGFILDEELYNRGLVNQDLANKILSLEQPQALVIADSSEPKSIEELRQCGINISPVLKGKDSVNQGISYVQSQRISVTKNSVNLIKEYRNYLWEIDDDGKALNKPIDAFNHLMDAIRYGFDALRVSREQDLEWEIMQNDMESLMWRKGLR